MSNWLVVGVNGAIGSALFAHLQSQYTNVHGTTQRPQAVKPNVHYLNLLDSPNLWQLPAAQVVFLCAGMCRMAGCEEDPETTRAINVHGTLNLIRHYANQGAFIVYLSTNQVFSGDKAYVIPSEPYAPLNEYGKQKAETEAAIKNFYQQVAIVRLTKVITPNMALFANWLQQLRNQVSIEAFNDMVLAPVSSRQVVNTLQKIGEKKISGTYQLSGSKDISYYDAACFLAEAMDAPLDLVRGQSALSQGFKKTFLPRFTTLDCSSTIAISNYRVPSFYDVITECFNMQHIVGWNS